MDSFFFENFRDTPSNWGFSAIINGLTDKNTTYNIIYEAIMNHPSYIIFSEAKTEHKVAVILKMINHYESREDYEKCAELLIIKKQLLNNIC